MHMNPLFIGYQTFVFRGWLQTQKQPRKQTATFECVWERGWNDRCFLKLKKKIYTIELFWYADFTNSFLKNKKIYIILNL